MGHQKFSFTADVYTHLYTDDDPDAGAALDARFAGLLGSG